MANFHSRSNSFPSQSHPSLGCVEDHLCRLKSSKGTSTSASVVCENLASLGELQEGINNLIQMSSTQQALSRGQDQILMNELLEGSLRLVDLCELSRDVVGLTKESIQDLESSMRRNGGEAATSNDIKAYEASRKKINKMVKKCLKNLNSKNNTACPGTEYATVLKEAESLDCSVLKSALILLSGEKESIKQKSWSMLSKFTQTSRVHSEVETEELCSLDIHDVTVKKLRASLMIIQELEEGLESLFRSLVKTRVSLLNVLSH